MEKIEIEYAKSAGKAVSRYDKPTKLAIKEHIEEGLTKTPPEGDIKLMQGYSDGRLRLRVGKYRIIFNYKTINGEKVLYIMDIDSRGDIYK